ncbi:UDP-glucuronosyltransferase 1-6-like [Scaptodrosophila lebanonensis]|uniref:UDP-glucuronosyltransferase 1-6-like n=1 Tax=Drosophila lebanonensis TaxID=7225 RepID=A0A6J2U649_DROLE|nr:UDP-glucuronosyltransferase 1-6-like [Scaptodrosophila lebanonensis]
MCSLLFLLFLLLPLAAQSANILGLFTATSPSHLIIHVEMMRTLAERGHNVTILTMVPPPTPVPHGIQHLLVPMKDAYKDELRAAMDQLSKQKYYPISFFRIYGVVALLARIQEDILNDARFRDLYENPHNKFDLMFLGYYLNLAQLGVAAKFNCPVIMNWVGGPIAQIDSLSGNPSEISYVPSSYDPIQPGEVMGFSKRLHTFLKHWYNSFLERIVEAKMKQQYNRIFRNETDFPCFSCAKRRISLFFSNYHSPSEGPIRPLVPAYIEVGGLQIKEQPGELPLDLANFLNTAENGVILFSLGTNFKNSFMTPKTVRTLYEAFSQLKQRVIWKWENLDSTPGNASNILYKKWLPQSDILAHPKLKLFITHAGKGGIAEAQYHGVPMLAFPIFGDQPGNAANMVRSGFGLSLHLQELNAIELQNTLKELLENNKYERAVKQYSKIYRDRPMTARQLVVYWTEYVLRHKGAYHLQSPWLRMSFVERNNLDVLALIIVLLCSLMWIIKKLVLFIRVTLKKPTKKCKTN